MVLSVSIWYREFNNNYNDNNSNKRDKSPDLAKELKKHESDSDTNCNWYVQYSH